MLDLTRVLAGPYGTMLLGDMGATVIKIEPPWGDETRRTPPFKDGAGVPFELVNRNRLVDQPEPLPEPAARRRVARAMREATAR